MPRTIPALNDGAQTYFVRNGVVHKKCGVPDCGKETPITWGEKVGAIGKIIRVRRKPKVWNAATGRLELTGLGFAPRIKKVTMCDAHYGEFEAMRLTAEPGQTPFIKVEEL